MVQLNGKVALVTGAAQGLGKAFALRLAAEGVTLALCDIQPAVDSTARDIDVEGKRAIAGVFDIASPTASAQFVSEVTARFGGIDILINNAAVWRPTPVGVPWDQALTDFDDLMNVNLRGAMTMMRLCVPSMIARGGGDIVNLSADYVLPKRRDSVNSADTDVYNATKWALNGLTDGPSHALAPHNIRVNGLALGPVDTEMLRDLFKPGGKLAHLGGPDGPPPEIAAGFMDPADVAALLVELLHEGRSGENIGVWAGRPIGLGPRKRWDVRIRERADFTGRPLHNFGEPPWTDAPEPVGSLATGRSPDE